MWLELPVTTRAEETTPVPRGAEMEYGEDPVGAATPEEAGVVSIPAALETPAGADGTAPLVRADGSALEPRAIVVVVAP